MDELIELSVDRSKPLPFTHEGKALKARPMPLQLAVQISEPSKDGKLDVSVELMADLISNCVVTEDGSRVYSQEDVMNADHDMMLPLLRAVIFAFDTEEPAKN